MAFIFRFTISAFGIAMAAYSSEAMAERTSVAKIEQVAEQCFFLGHTKLVTAPGQFKTVLPLAGGRALILIRPDNSLRIARGVDENAIRTLNSKDLVQPKAFGTDVPITENQVSPNGRYSLFSAGSGFILDTQKMVLTKISDEFEGGFFSPNNRFVILRENDGVSIFDIEKKLIVRSTPLESKSVVATDRESESLFILNYAKFPSALKSVVRVDMRAGSETTFTGDHLKVETSAKSKLTTLTINGVEYPVFKPRWSRTLTTGATHGRFDFVDNSGRRTLSFREGSRRIDLAVPTGQWQREASLDVTDETVVTSIMSGDVSTIALFDKTRFVCSKPVKMICSDCKESNDRDRSDQAYVDQRSKFQNGDICGSKYDERDARWKSFVPNLHWYNQRGEIERWLILFSKKDGFNPSKHLPILEGLLDSDEIMTSYGSLMSLVLANVMSESTNLYSSLLVKYPLIRKLPTADMSCLAPEDHKHYAKFAYSVLKRQLLSTHFDRPFSDYKYFAQFNSFLAQDEKAEFADLIGEGAARYATQRDGTLQAIFFSKIYQFAHQSARRMLGLSFKEITDVTVTAKYGSTAQSVVLGTSRISKDSKLTEAGFYMEPGPQFNYDSTGNLIQIKDFNWTHSGKNYVARFTAKATPIEVNWMINEPSVRYAELESDGVFRGLIVAGTNLATAKETLNEYRSYFEGEGFVFGSPVVNDNFNEYLKSKVAGREPMDYMIKEAHSDGDDRNLFRMSKQTTIIIGTKRSKNRVEVIELVYPSFEKGSDLISNVSFGEWVREREAAKIGQLVYVNSSCWSHNKAAAEIAAAHSPVLLEIATTTTAYTFSDSRQSALRILVEALHEGKSNAEIRADLKQNPNNAKNLADIYIFPDEPEYTNKIFSKLRSPFDVTLTLFENSRIQRRLIPYHLDERVN